MDIESIFYKAWQNDEVALQWVAEFIGNGINKSYSRDEVLHVEPYTVGFESSNGTTDNLAQHAPTGRDVFYYGNFSYRGFGSNVTYIKLLTRVIFNMTSTSSFTHGYGVLFSDTLGVSAQQYSFNFVGYKIILKQQKSIASPTYAPNPSA